MTTIPLAEDLSATLSSVFATAGLDPGAGLVVRSSRPEAPYQCNGAMAAAKAAGTNPRTLAERLAEGVRAARSDVAVEVAGPGFLNLTPSPESVTNRARALAADPRTGARADDQPSRVVIDFGGANVAKPMHVGHLRSSVIGDCLQRLFRFRGHVVTSDIHMGDWGLQMGQLIVGLEEEQPNLPYFAEETAGPFPTVSPVSLDDLARIYPVMSTRSKTDEAVRERARKATAALQAGRPGYRALLKHFIDVSVAGLRADYDRLGVGFDLWKGESDAAPFVPELVQMFKDQGVAVLDDGAWIVKITEEGDKKELAPLILVSSEGSALYATTDLATILDRVRSLAPDLILYVVDQRQHEHFEQVFRAAAKAGLIGRNALEHIGFGTVNGPDGRPFKTREGGVLRLADLLDMATEKAEERLTEAGLAADMSPEERAEVAHKVALAAIKFSDLQNHRLTNYIFDLDRFTRFEGKTGPYLLYAAVRIASLQRKAAAEGVTPGPITAAAPEEIALVLELDAFDAVLREAEARRAPNVICDHAFALAQAFAKFYAECPVLAAPDPDTRASRLGLAEAAGRQLALALGLLGLEGPARM